MSICRKVSTTFWSDGKIADDFTPEDRYFYLYLLTNPHTNLCGCYELSVKQAADELGYKKEFVEKLLDRFTKIHRVIAYDKGAKELLLCNWSKYNWTKSPKFQSALKKEIVSVKCPKFKAFLEKMMLVDGEENTVSIPYEEKYNSTIYISDSDTDTDTDSDSVTVTGKDNSAESSLYHNIVDYLNEKASTKYRHSSADTRRKIKARLSEGFTLEDFKTVIDKKCAEWKDTEMEKYLRPETLFGPKFESYLNAKITKKKSETGSNIFLSMLKDRGVIQ